MSKPLDDDFNYDRKPVTTPREAKGGAIAPADISLIKNALCAYAKSLDEDDIEVSKIAHLLHRLGRIA